MAYSNPLVWFEIYVQDMERARIFYEMALKLKPEKLNAPAAPASAAGLELRASPMAMGKSGAAAAWSRWKASSQEVAALDEMTEKASVGTPFAAHAYPRSAAALPFLELG